jgi:hypothetical protein
MTMQEQADALAAMSSKQGSSGAQQVNASHKYA